jgi:hypothetical protein
MVLSDSRRRWVALIVALAAGLLGLLVLPPMISGTPTTAAAPPAATTPSDRPPTQTPTTPPTFTCAVIAPPHYYRYDDGRESLNAFGPPVESFFGFAATRQTFTRRMCGFVDIAAQKDGGDWALLATYKHVVDGTDLNQHYKSAQEWAALLDDFMSRIQWDNAVPFRNLHPMPAKSYYMLENKQRGPPMVALGHKVEPASNYLLLPVTRYNGTTVWLMLRYECGFQPVFPDKPLTVPNPR